MFRRVLFAVVLVVAVAGLIGCRHNRVQNPIAEVDSKQPDKVLFDRSMEAMRKGRFDTARMTLQTLINTYPDSEFLARAKLAIGDSWYAEGGSTALAQAEIEYKDFITFFPNMPEAAEAQLKVADIHFKQMEKPDRDYTHAKRAEEEYKQVLLQFPDSQLVEKAKLRLLAVQEVLAEREFRIGRFYWLRESWPASIARLKSVTDTYPLYSKADEALFMLGQAYESQAELVRNSALPEAAKERAIAQLLQDAAAAYARIVTKYPVMARAEDAKQRLEALKQPVPKPTPEAIAENRKIEESRGSMGRWGSMMSNLRKAPVMVTAAKAGDPTLVEPKQTSAIEVAQRMAGKNTASGGSNTVSVETVGNGAPPPNDAPPSSNPPAPSGGDSGIPELTPNAGTEAPNSAPAETTQATPAPRQQVNEAAPEHEAQQASSNPGDQAKADDGNKDGKKDDKKFSSSKKKKKSGLRKIIPF